MFRGFHHEKMDRGRGFARSGREEYRARRDAEANPAREENTCRPFTRVSPITPQNTAADQDGIELQNLTDSNRLPGTPPVSDLYASWCSWLEGITMPDDGLGGMYS